MNHLSHRAASERRMHSKHLQEVDFDRSPFTVLWEVTRACALACRHCRAKAQPKPDPRQLTTEESLRLVDQIAEFGSPILVFTGGDPMMRRDLEQLIRYASQEKGLRTSLTPSSTALVTKKRLKSVMDAGIRRIALSLDGPNAEIHDSFRGFSGSFQRTMEILQDAQDVGLSVQVNTTVTKINLPYLEEMVPFLERYGAVQWSLFFLVPVGRARIEDMISPQEHEQVYNWLYDLSKNAPFDVKATNAQPYRRVAIQRARAETQEKDVAIQGAGFQYADGLHRPVKGVNDGKGVVFISHVGEVYPTGFFPLSAGNVRHRSVVDIYRNSALFRDLRDGSKLKGKCAVCEFKDVCGGNRSRAYALTGDPLESEPTCVWVPPKYREMVERGEAEPVDEYFLRRIKREFLTPELVESLRKVAERREDSFVPAVRW